MSLSISPIPVPTVRAYLNDVPNKAERPVVAVSAGPHLVGSLPPHADPSCPETLLDGVNKRMGANLPPGTVNREDFLSDFKAFVSKRVVELFPKVNWEADWTVETWLDNTHYPQWRKDELLKYRDDIDDMLRRGKHGELVHFCVKLFMKDEHYVDWKHARGIYARDEAAKLTFGPWFKLMEEIVYQHPFFIKHVPVANRAEYIYDLLFMEGKKYFATDYSSFEAHFDADLMESCEFILYQHLIGEVPGGADVLSIMREVLTGKNIIVNKFIRATCEARRMSGEMNTSLGNGFSNFMLAEYIAHKKGLKVTFVVEGDDMLGRVEGGELVDSDYTQYGLNVKLGMFTDISKASFCGLLFDPEDRIIVTDPYKVVSLFGWNANRYRNANLHTRMKLLRCKALSLAHQYPRCPIIQPLAQYGLRVTRSYDVSDFIEKRKDLDLFNYSRLKDALAQEKKLRKFNEPTPVDTRLLVEELYDIDIKSQNSIEDLLNGLNSLAPLNIPELSDYVPQSWRDYWDNYVLPYRAEHISGDQLQLFHPKLRV